MCFADATLFYGLWVTTASLNFAAAAHQATRGPVLAIDIITRRRRAGKLEVEGQGERTTARELPEEVWVMIKHELLGVEVRHAEVDTLDGLRCTRCRDDHSIRWGEALVDGEERGPPVKHTWTFWEEHDCFECMCNVANSATTYSRSTVQLQHVSDLLHDYGLQLASPTMWVEEDDDCVCDFNSLSAIALPSSSDGVEMPLTTTAKYSNDTQTSVSTVLATDPSGFSRPVDAGLRFRHLLKDYNLCRGGQAHSTILPPTSTAPSKTPHPPAVDVEEGRMQSELFAEDEPRWMVWSYCEVCM